MTIPTALAMRAGARIPQAFIPRFFAGFAITGIGAKGESPLFSSVPGYSRLGFLCLLLLAAGAAAQQPEIQFVRAWQGPERGGAFDESSGFALAPDGTALIADRERGALWRIPNTPTPAPVSVVVGGSKDVAFEAKKLGGVAWLGNGRVALANTRNDLLAILDANGKPERVFAGSGSGAGELDDPNGLYFSANRRLYGNKMKVILFMADVLVLKCKEISVDFFQLFYNSENSRANSSIF